LARSGRYEDMIRRVLREEGVPQDLIYLAQAESGFHPVAVSRAGARGMWQFMGSRAAGYGLERNWWVDDRQDPEKATRAAAHHLKDLYKEFGDWYLAMAAYNSGPGTVQSAVKRTGYADFWELYNRDVLPKETRNYVPSFWLSPSWPRIRRSTDSTPWLRKSRSPTTRSRSITPSTSA